MNTAGAAVFAQSLLIALCLEGVLMVSCQYAKPACTVIDIADKACEFVSIKYPDGRVQTVRKTEVLTSLERAGLVKP